MEQKIAMCKYAKDMRAKGKLFNTQLAAWATRAFKLKNLFHAMSLAIPQIQETDARITKVFKAMDGKVEAITGKVIKAINVSSHARPAIALSNMAYDEISPKTIQNCWRHAGILSDRSKIASLLN
ncbi:hypothetical protein PInf_015463 [Phytophthora infestans]|nr:hypothetical protein PInf_015463 [Phytophthora infestans]